MGSDVRPYVVVVGGANVDICGRPQGLLVAYDSNLGTVRLAPGGVGRNIAHNLALLDVSVELVSCFGQDALASSLRQSCEAAGIGIGYALEVPGAATSTYLYVTDETGEMQLAVNDMAILDQLTPERIAERTELLEGAALVVVDTNLPEATLRWIAANVHVPLFCDPISTAKAARIAGVLGSLHTLKPNLLQAEMLSGVLAKDEASLHVAAEALLATGLGRAFVSLGAEGVLCADHERVVKLPLAPGRVVNTTGAGDAMMAGLVWAYLHGLDLEETGRVGLAMAAIACESDSAVNPQTSEAMLQERLRAGVLFSS